MLLRALRCALVVDRDADHRALFTDILRDLDFTTIPARNEQVAFDIPGHGMVDLVFVDIGPTTADGPALIRHLREHNYSLPIVALSTSESARDWAEEIGADAFIAKPFDLAQLQGVVNRLCPSH
jgi:CheY-like chemotaxis protein